jgi:hypothetical protein
MRSVYSPPPTSATDPFGGDLLATGNETIPRTLANSFGATHMAGSGFIMLSMFTAYRTEVANFVATQTGSVGAGATPTLCKMGLYLVNGNYTNSFDVTLLSATANDTTLFSNPYSGYKRPLLTPTQLVAGVRYAFGILVVSASSMPSIVCALGAINDTYGSAKSGAVPSGSPATVQQSTVQADMVSLTNAQITAQGSNWNKAWAYFSNT